jgi:FkbM family methyltransferase
LRSAAGSNHYGHEPYIARAALRHALGGLMHADLIFDLGMHNGDDTDYYLRKGFRVVAVEADPETAEAGRRRFREPLESGRLTIVNKAVARAPGVVTFYRSENSLWSTLDEARVALVERKGSHSQPIEVETVRSGALIEAFGAPYYMKIDIEGMDVAALEGLSDAPERPRFISIEAERRDLRTCREELSLLASLGYDRFKVVPQHTVHLQREPRPPREGTAAGTPKKESSGLFGRDLPGRWLTEAEALDAFRRPLLNHYLTGSDALVRSKWLRAGLKRLGFRAGWYDIHATSQPFAT